MSIPKIIHYCWFGKKRKSKLIKDCINSWKVHLNGYEFIEWNEKKSDLSNPFVREAYKLKKWAFVADYIRLKVLSEHGGIYLDTDMMVIRDFSELLKLSSCFFGAEDDEFISAGIIGAAKNHSFINKCLKCYDTIRICKETDLGKIAIPRIITKLFKNEFNFSNPFNEIVKTENIIIYPALFFYPLPYTEKENIEKFKEYLSDDSFAVHLWNSSWIEMSEFYYLSKGEYSKGLKMAVNSIVIKKVINYFYLRKIVSSIKESIK